MNDSNRNCLSPEPNKTKEHDAKSIRQYFCWICIRHRIPGAIASTHRRFQIAKATPIGSRILSLQGKCLAFGRPGDQHMKSKPLDVKKKGSGV